MDKSSIIFEMEFGSHVYGTNIQSSDKDYKGIYLPHAKDIILSKAQETYNSSTKSPGQLKNSSTDIDMEIFSLKKYMKLLLEGQTVALTMLFCPKKHCLTHTNISHDIVRYKDRWLHKGVTAFAGYCRQQANKYGIKGSRVAAVRSVVTLFLEHLDSEPHMKISEMWHELEAAFTGAEHCEFLEVEYKDQREGVTKMFSCCNRKVQEHITVKEAYKIYKHVFDEYGQRALQAESSENVDWKACMHAIRVAGEAKELLLDHNITYPRPDRDLLVNVRTGQLPYPEVAALIEQGLIDMEEAQLKSTLPEKPDFEFAEDFIFNTYYNRIKEEVLDLN